MSNKTPRVYAPRPSILFRVSSSFSCSLLDLYRALDGERARAAADVHLEAYHAVRAVAGVESLARYWVSDLAILQLSSYLLRGYYVVQFLQLVEHRFCGNIPHVHAIQHQQAGEGVLLRAEVGFVHQYQHICQVLLRFAIHNGEEGLQKVSWHELPSSLYCCIRLIYLPSLICRDYNRMIRLEIPGAAQVADKSGEFRKVAMAKSL